MSWTRVSCIAGLCLTTFATLPAWAQLAEPNWGVPAPTPSPAPAARAPATGSGATETAPGAAQTPAAEPPLPAGQTPDTHGSSEPPPASNPYPTSRGLQPRRWTSDDMARVRRMLEAERARRGQLAARARNGQRPATEPEAPQRYGDAGSAIGLGLSLDAVFHSDVGFRLFDQSKASTRFGMWVSHDLAMLSKVAVLSAELGFGVEANDGNADYNNDVLPMHLHTSTFHGALSARWNACSFFAPHVRASGGVSVLDLDVASSGDTHDTDRAVSGFGALGVGFLVHTPPRLFENRSGHLASLKLGVMFEAGYALRSSVQFALENHAPARGIAVVNAGLGQLDLSGAYLRTSLVARF